jgi:hypothetical protein
MTQAVLKAGLITPNMLREIKRFSVTIDRDAEVEEPKELELAAKIVADALESQEYTVVRETDLDVLHEYLESHVDGVLHLEAVESVKPVEFEVSYCVSKMGEYVVAWTGERLFDVLTNGTTFLRTAIGDVFFKDVHELWYGGRKAFMVCTPREVVNGHGG